MHGSSLKSSRKAFSCSAITAILPRATVAARTIRNTTNESVQQLVTSRPQEDYGADPKKQVKFYRNNGFVRAPKLGENVYIWKPKAR